VQEVSLELSKGKGENKLLVLWVLDSFSSLVTNALKAEKANQADIAQEYAGVISMLFNLHASMIPLPVASSSTTAGALSRSKLSPYKFSCSL